MCARCVQPKPEAAVREFIHRGGGCVVSVGQLLDELSDKLGDRFRVSPDMHKLLDLIVTLWEDPHIAQVPHTGLIEFAWNEKGADPAPTTGFKAMLLRRSNAWDDDKGVGDGQQ